MSFIRRYKKNGKVYLAEVENKKINGKVVQKFIQHIGKEVDDQKILSVSISNVKVDEVKIFGPLLVLNQIAEELRFKENLGKYANEILALIFAHCIDPKSLNKMEDWFTKTDLNYLLSLEYLTEKKLLDALDSLANINQEELNKNLYKIAEEKYKLKGGGVVYDVTNTYLYGKKCPLGKFGKDKRGTKGSKLIQIGLGVTKEEGFPVFHKVFNGNIADARTLTDLISIFSSLGVEKGIIVFDRGISSEGNIMGLRARGWHSVCGLKSTSSLKKIVEKEIDKEKLISLKNRVKSKSSIFYVTTKKYSMGKINGILAICFNERRAREQKESRYDEIMSAKESIREGEGIKTDIKKFFWPNGSIKYAVVEKEEKLDGISFVFSTKEIKKEDLVRLYFTDKDIVEKAFQSMKGIISLRPIRHWLYDRVKAHVFICYLSYMLLSVFKIKLKDKMSISPSQAIEDLSSMYKVYFRDEKKGMKISRVVTLTKHQEKIIKAVDKKLLNTLR